MGKSLVAGISLPVIDGQGEYLNARVTLGIRLDNGQGGVGRRVIHTNDLHVPHRLPKQRVQAMGQITGRVIHSDQNGDLYHARTP